jgi:hypothetical protein
VTADQLRAIAAMEVLGTVLTSATYGYGDVPEAELRDVLLRAALDVLHVEPEESEMRSAG